MALRATFADPYISITFIYYLFINFRSTQSIIYKTLSGAHNWGEAVPADIEQQVEQIESDVKKDQAEEVQQGENVEGFVFVYN